MLRGALSTLGSTGSRLKAARVWCLGVGLLPYAAPGPVLGVELGALVAVAPRGSVERLAHPMCEDFAPAEETLPWG